MRNTIVRWCVVCLFVCVGVVGAAGKPTRVIFFIGDGMGPEHVHAARLYAGEPMSFERLPGHGMVTTRSADNAVTDSAASATAMAAGVKVNNGVIALAIPGDKRPLPTILEQLKARGWATGLVTNDELVGATPAGFGSHAVNRKDAADIVKCYLTQTQPDVLLGGGGGGMDASAFAKAGYATATDVASFGAAAKRVAGDKALKLCGVFGPTRFPYRYHDELLPADKREYGVTYPQLADMTTAALNTLDRDPDGFFVMIESAMTDKSGHASGTKGDADRTGCNVYATVTLSRAVQAALDWAKGRDDVLILVTADHETGGMSIAADNGKGKLPTVKWSHKSHTAVNVDVFSTGPGSERFTGTIDNTDLYKILAEVTGAGLSKAAAAAE
ncbi:MAG: alkaline phosphatase [Phycisphaera sp.]|nr:alkaline phosphatase [Phycisphaera sp.]